MGKARKEIVVSGLRRAGKMRINFSRATAKVPLVRVSLISAIAWRLSTSSCRSSFHFQAQSWTAHIHHYRLESENDRYVMADSNQQPWSKLYPVEPLFIPALKVGAWTGESSFVELLMPFPIVNPMAMNNTYSIERKGVFAFNISFKMSCAFPAPSGSLIHLGPSSQTDSHVGASGLLVGGIGGIIHSPTPGLFAIASGLQCAALGTAYYGKCCVIPTNHRNRFPFFLGPQALTPMQIDWSE